VESVDNFQINLASHQSLKHTHTHAHTNPMNIMNQTLLQFMHSVWSVSLKAKVKYRDALL